MKNKKILKRLKIIGVLCVIILILEIIFVCYSLFIKNKESLYFDGINGLASTSEYYVTVGSNNDNDNYYEKAKISKYNKRREKTFEKLYNVGYNSSFFGVCLDNNSMVAVGSYEKSKKDHNESVRRGLIVFYNEDGKIEFENEFTLLDNTKFTSIVKVDGGYLVTGQSVYKNTHVGSEEGGAILLKYDNKGNLLWYKTYGSSKSAVFNDLLVLDNYIYTVGIDDNYKGIICKYDMNGNIVGFNDYKYTDELGFSGIVNIGNSIFISGSNRESIDSINAMIVEYDLDCNYIGQNIYKGNGITRYNKLIRDNHNNIIGIGIMTNTGDNKNKRADTINYDGIIGKYKSNLDEVKVINYGDDRDDYFTDIEVIDGEYLVVGYSSYEDGSYLSKFIRYSDALKQLGVD